MNAQPSTVWLARLVPEDRPAWTSAVWSGGPLEPPAETYIHTASCRCHPKTAYDNSRLH